MIKLRIILVVALLGVFFSANSQRRYNKSLNQTYGVQKHRPAKFRTNKKAAVICPTFVASEYPYQGIGIKLGDPFAITYNSAANLESESVVSRIHEILELIKGELKE